MHKIVFLDAATLAEAVVLPTPAFAHEWRSFPSTLPEEICARAKEAEIVITNKVGFDAKTIASLPKLKLIAIAATGYDHVDLDAARTHGVAVTNIRGYSVNSVPEHVFALILALARKILPYVADVRAGEWQASQQFAFHTHQIIDLHGRRLGLFGSGSLGQRVAELARAFGMDVVFAGRKGRRAKTRLCRFRRGSRHLGHSVAALSAQRRDGEYDRRGSLRRDEEKAPSDQYVAGRTRR